MRWGVVGCGTSGAVGRPWAHTLRPFRQERVCWALDMLARHDPVHGERIVAAGIVPLLRDGLRTHARDVYYAEWGAKLLSVLASGSPKHAVGTSGHQRAMADSQAHVLVCGGERVGCKSARIFCITNTLAPLSLTHVRGSQMEVVESGLMPIVLALIHGTGGTACRASMVVLRQQRPLTLPGVGLAPSIPQSMGGLLPWQSMGPPASKC